jgi:hypothetical protein
MKMAITNWSKEKALFTEITSTLMKTMNAVKTLTKL